MFIFEFSILALFGGCFCYGRGKKPKTNTIALGDGKTLDNVIKEIPEDPKEFWPFVIKRLAENAELKGKIKSVIVTDSKGKKKTIFLNK